MRVVDEEFFRSANEEFRDDIAVVEIIEDKKINWRNFKAADAVIKCKENCRKVSINLDGIVIDGNLTINGLHQKLNSIEIINVEAQKVVIYNVKAKKIEITGNVGNIEIINSSADDYHICGEIEKSIFLTRSGSRKSSFELNGCARNVRLKNVMANDFKIKSFKCDKLIGEDIKIKKLHLSTDWKSKLKAVDIEELHLFNSKKATGVIYNLKNATLKF